VGESEVIVARLGVILFSVRVVAAATLVVGRGEHYDSVRQAIAQAAAGDTIQVESGTYPGNLVLDKPLTLDGVGKPVIRGDGRASVVTVLADGCTIRGLILEHSGGMLVKEDAGLLLRSSGNHIEQNELRDVLFGIYFFASSRNIVTGNVIHGRAYLGVGERGSGIHIYNASENMIAGNTITQTRDGMYLQYANHSTIRGNRVSDVRYGLHYMYSDDNTFEDNSFSRNVAGAAIMYSRRINFRRNVFVHNRGVSSFGILFQEDENCVAEDNVFVDNAVGIFMEALRGTVFRRNLIAANDTALRIFSSATGNTFEANNFIDNLSPVEVIGRSTDTRWSGAHGGNYWSEYDGYDLNSDGIGDVPFKIQNVFQYLEGDYPRIRIYLYSPASQALAAAEKAFPVFEGSREFDRRPLMKPVMLRTPAPEKVRRAGIYPFAISIAMLLIPAMVYRKGRKP
jgi:nitrous oxidase accessory protein